MREIVLNIINTKGSIKGIDLALAVMESINPTKFEYGEYLEILKQLVEQGEIIEMEYLLLPNKSTKEIYFPKHIYFPKGTVIQ